MQLSIATKRSLRHSIAVGLLATLLAAHTGAAQAQTASKPFLTLAV